MQREAQLCAQVIRDTNQDLRILQSEINMIESMEPDPYLMTTPNYYGHMQLTKLVNLVGNLRDWH